MITSINSACPIFFKNNSSAENSKLHKNKSAIGNYADSFLKHSADSVPTLLSVTAIWAGIDKTTRNIPFKQAFANNMKVFFLPVLVASSALLSYIDNRNTKTE